jgi:hypothetical protein
MGTPKYLCYLWIYETVLRGKVTLWEGGNITIKKIVPLRSYFSEFQGHDVVLNGIIYLFFYFLVEHKKGELSDL